MKKSSHPSPFIILSIIVVHHYISLLLLSAHTQTPNYSFKINK